MTDYPSESSLVVNATQQQLSQSPFTAGIAIAPSQREEAEGGYDIAFDTASRLELQYKAVYSEIDDRTFRRGHTMAAVKFPFDGAQAKTLLGRQTGPVELASVHPLEVYSTIMNAIEQRIENVW